ncbi:hypothetical protein [Microbacterium panaciterrae]|uniref:Alpha/beta hydrolase n=1 Tax=Microbacterium panaciterrae TaxID=985759 RepID=A0ABP8P4G6_9MICO
MGDDIDITRGGIIAIDPDDLRGIGNRILYASVAVDLAEQELLAIPDIIAATTVGPMPCLWAATTQLRSAGEALTRLASTTGTLSDVYELAELRAQQHLIAGTDRRLEQAYQLRIDELLRNNVHLPAVEAALRQEWDSHRTDGFVLGEDPSPLAPENLAALMLGPITPGLFALLSAGRILSAGIAIVGDSGGVVPASKPLTATPGVAVVRGADAPAAAPALRPGDVLVTRGADPVPVRRAPASLTDAIARVPSGKAPQVRVETYELNDGSRRFVAYVDGTRPAGGKAEPWNMRSNKDAYLDHEESDSYKATVAALKDAGADASTPVDLVGYSQGGMITGLIAQSGEFDVQGVFTVGSPIEPQLPADVLDVAVRHTDDLVAVLAGGGAADGTGSPDSLVITRTAVPGHGIDPHMPAHQLAEYQETVRRAEQSGDPRMDVIREHFAALDGAKITSRDYTATTVLPDASPQW